MWLPLIGRPALRDDSAAAWDARTGSLVWIRRRGRLLGAGTRTTEEDRVPALWAGTDVGKAEHHCTVIDTDGSTMLSRRVPNSESELLELLGDVLELADGAPVIWTVDLNTGGAALCTKPRPPIAAAGKGTRRTRSSSRTQTVYAAM
jgi:hypothetical protein